MGSGASRAIEFLHLVLVVHLAVYVSGNVRRSTEYLLNPLDQCVYRSVNLGADLLVPFGTR